MIESGYMQGKLRLTAKELMKIKKSFGNRLTAKLMIDDIGLDFCFAITEINYHTQDINGKSRIEVKFNMIQAHKIITDEIEQK